MYEGLYQFLVEGIITIKELSADSEGDPWKS